MGALTITPYCFGSASGPPDVGNSMWPLVGLPHPTNYAKATMLAELRTQNAMPSPRRPLAPNGLHN